MSNILSNLAILLRVISTNLLIYSLIRIEFLVWNWANFKNQPVLDILSATLWGVRFDLAALVFVFFPTFIACFVWWSRFQKYIYWIISLNFIFIALPLLVLNMVDIEFVNFVGRRFTADTLFVWGEAQGKVTAFWDTYKILFIINILILLLSLYLNLSQKKMTSILSDLGKFNFNKFKNIQIFNVNIKYKKALIILIFIFVYLIASRGGLQKKPLSFAHTQMYASSHLNQLVLNTPFAVIKSMQKKSVQRVQHFKDPSKMLSLLNGANQKVNTEDFSNQNIVIIVLESFALEYMGLPNGYKGYTPFLDKLAQRSLFFKNNFANGRRSIEGICALLTAIPALMTEPFISSQYQANHFVGLGEILNTRGYETAFFHGGNNGTMFFDQFTKAAGIQKYYGANEHPDQKDHDGVWGIYDEPFFQFSIQQMNQFKKPFFSMIFSLSSHHPYQIPPHLKGQFDKGTLEIHESIGYTDYALKKFFETAETQSWYDNTLFIITADHAQKSDQAQYQNELGQYLVPLIFFHPQNKLPKVTDLDQPTQQIDVLPSVLDYLGIEIKEQMLLARSVFANGDRYIVQYLDGQYLIVDKSFYALKNHEFKVYQRSDVNKKNPVQDQNSLLDKLKATEQYFSQGMWDNKLYYPTVK